MNQPLDPEKSRKLRPLRIVLAVLIAVLLVLILERLPTSVKDRTTSSSQTTGTPAPEGSKYYYLNGLLDILENQTEDKLRALGVPEEEFSNVGEYLSKDELFIIETKATLASSLEETYVEADEAGIAELRTIFGLKENYSFEKFSQLSTAPAEYKILSDLLTEYHTTLDTVEDYDEML